MPYYRPYRRYRRRRYRRRGRRVARRRQDYASMARTALSTAKWVASMINVEFKHHDVVVTTPPPVNAVANLLTGIGQGDTTVSRDGNSVKLQDIDLTFQLIHNSAATGPTYVRLVVFMDKQTAQVTPDNADLFDGTTTSAHRNIDNTKRFYVYYDRTVTLNDQRPSLTFKKHISTKAHVRFNGPGSSITDIASNPIFCLAYSNQATNSPNYRMESRVRYVDN